MSTAPAGSSLRLALVVATGEDACSVVRDGERRDVEYAPFFPRPRVERVAPGHLVALAPGADGGDLVVWRWYDAVVLDREGDQWRLWEPGHGEVLARPRDPAAAPALGSRAYASAGLPGADWWLAGPVVTDPALAAVDTAHVERFLAEHGLWAAPR